ncbi:helix-turn-helix transcriptional regulator [Alkalimarinus alittae]|uniref:WYL domain-containing protein n=1 Tax=Alkalimarinus alittae TaxID=2961619 RepID=A0ABY6MYA9_9ALTE|nr:WYL domain-containing protein [Alkalimarinus alittae]UZE94814.1 WYL domain-containing protein [Alkalimarinus alittae]
MADSAVRQLVILTLIPRAPASITTSDIYRKVLDAGFNCGRKTTERDLDALTSFFPITTIDESSKPYRWCFDKFEMIEIPRLTPQMALTLSLINKHSQNLLPKNALDYLSPYFKQAEKELASLSDNTLSKWQDKVHVVHNTLSFEPPIQKDEITDQLYLALIQGKQVKATYQARGKEAREYQLNPISLVLRGQQTYILCTSSRHETVLQFLINRFSSVEITDQKIHENSLKIDVQAYLDQGAFGMLKSKEKLKLIARVQTLKGWHLHETPLSKDQEIIHDQDDSFLLKATVADSHHLVWWILSLGDRIEVLEPASLREVLVGQVKGMAARYGVG